MTFPLIFLQQQFARIDSEVYERITAGFQFDGQTFSLSPTAQLKMIGWQLKLDALPYPVTTSVLDNSTVYVISDAVTMQAFIDTAFGTFSAYYAVAMQTKTDALAALTEEDFIAVVDAYVVS